MLIVDRNVSLDDGSARLAQEHPASLLRLSEEAAGRWVYPDRPARLLDRLDGWRCFRTVEVPKFLIVDLPPSSASATRPVVLSRQQQALHPGSGDQASYWVSVLEAFRNATATETGAVPVLLIGSTASFNMVDLLSTALAEIGMGEIRPAHRTRREHLIRASKLGFGIVDFVDSWGAWQMRSAETGIELLPVVEALPIEEWYAVANFRASSSGVSQTQNAEETDEDLLPVRTALKPRGTPFMVSVAKLLEELPYLFGRFFTFWLEKTELDNSSRAVLIIDPRIDAVGRQFEFVASVRRLMGLPLSSEQRARLDVVFASIQIKREKAPFDFASMEAFLIANWQPPEGSDGNKVTGLTSAESPDAGYL